MIVKANTLVSQGLPPTKIKRLCHMKGSPFFQECKGGIWYVDTNKLDRWFDELAKKKEIEYG
ncbi:MAG: hypothetical protein J6U23_11155 [Clostridiales bacterium]|nr:hypothetical protein [Clostridiales bacterium]